MTDSEKAVQDFLAKGGKVNHIKEGVTSHDSIDYDPMLLLKNCSCGCEGNYTDHQMRKGERGIY